MAVSKRRLLRQPCLSQAVREHGEIVRPMKRQPVRKLGDAQRRDRACAYAASPAAPRPFGRQAHGSRRECRPRYRKLGSSLNAFSAHDDAASKRPANRCAIAVPACMRDISGSSGLRRIARAKRSMASSCSPRQILQEAAEEPGRARFGLSTSALSISAMPPSRSPPRCASAWPLRARATASSLPSSTARLGQPGAFGDLLRAIGPSSR